MEDSLLARGEFYSRSGEAWEELSKNKKIAVRAFRKCGISVAADGSEDFDIHLEGLEDYEIDEVNDLDDLDADSEDPFANLSDNSLTEDSSDDDSSEED